MILLENNKEFMLGRMTCNFIADSGEFCNFIDLGKFQEK